MKTPVMIEVFKKAQKGIISLDDSIKIKNEFNDIDGLIKNLDKAIIIYRVKKLIPLILCFHFH